MSEKASTQVKGHKLFLLKGTERSRSERASTACCPCGFYESHSTQEGARAEYAGHLEHAKPITECKFCKSTLPGHAVDCELMEAVLPTFGKGAVVYCDFNTFGDKGGEDKGVVTRETASKVWVKFSRNQGAYWFKKSRHHTEVYVKAEEKA